MPVDTVAPSDNQVITYDATSGKYKPKAGGGVTAGMQAVKYSIQARERQRAAGPAAGQRQLDGAAVAGLGASQGLAAAGHLHARGAGLRLHGARDGLLALELAGDAREVGHAVGASGASGARGSGVALGPGRAGIALGPGRARVALGAGVALAANRAGVEVSDDRGRRASAGIR